MFDHCPRNGKSVKSAGSTSNLIQNQKASGCGITENIGNFRHLHHKSTLTTGKVIRSPYPGKNPVSNSYIGFFCRNKTSDLCHKHNQGCLTHVSGFTSHVRSGDNRYPFFLVVKICIVCNEHIIFDHLLNHRMTAIFDIQYSVLINLGFHIIVSFCNQCKRSKDIQRSHCFGSSLNTNNFLSYLFTYLCKKFIFQCIKTVLCSEDHIFQIFQFLGDISLSVGKCLLTDIIFRNQIFERIGNFQCIPKNSAVFDLQGLNTGTFFFSGFQFCQPFLSICSGTAVFVYIFVITFPDDPSVFLCNRRLFHNRSADQLCNIFQRIHVLVYFFQDRCLKFSKNLADIGNHLQRRSKSYHISGIG